MPTLFSVKYSGQANIRPFHFNFNKIEVLIDRADILMEQFAGFDTDDMEITISEVDNPDEIGKFLSQFTDLTYTLLDDVDAGEYDDFIGDGSLARQFEYLTQDRQFDGELAVEKAKQVQMYSGDIADYVKELHSDATRQMGQYAKFIDWNKVAKEEMDDSNIVASGLDTWVVNAHSL